MERVCFDPALAFHIERMLQGGSDDLLLVLGILNGHMGNLIGGIDKGADDLLVSDFTGFLVRCQNHVTKLSVFDCCHTGCSRDHRTCHKALESRYGIHKRACANNRADDLVLIGILGCGAALMDCVVFFQCIGNK